MRRALRGCGIFVIFCDTLCMSPKSGNPVPINGLTGAPCGCRLTIRCCWFGIVERTRSRWSSNLCGADVVPNSLTSFGSMALASIQFTCIPQMLLKTWVHCSASAANSVLFSCLAEYPTFLSILSRLRNAYTRTVTLTAIIFGYLNCINPDPLLD